MANETTTPAGGSVTGMGQVWEALPRLAVIFAALGVGWASLTWMTGGLRPQTQIDVANLTKEVADLKATQSAGVAACAADRELLNSRINSAQQLFVSRLDAMWRPSDYAEVSSHFSRLDQEYDSLRDRVTNSEFAIKDLNARYQVLTAVPPPTLGRR